MKTVHELAVDAWAKAQAVADEIEPICNGEKTTRQQVDKIIRLARTANSAAQAFYCRATGQQQPKEGD